MCLPVLGILGTVVSAIGTIASAQAQASQMEYNAKVAEINARTARQAGLANADAKEDEYQALRGRQRAAAAAAGVNPASGSAALIINDKSYRDEYLDTANIIWDAETQAVGYENKAKDLRAQAKSTKTAGFIGGASTILGGFSKLPQQGTSLRLI